MGNVLIAIILILTVAAISGAMYFAYPWMEEFIFQKLESYLSDCEMLLHRMFREMPRKKMTWIIASLTIGMSLAAFLFTIQYRWWVTVPFTVLFGLIGYLSFRVWLKILWERRLRTFNEQIVDALNLLANSLKAGLNLSQSLQVLVQESKDPISQEFSMILSQEKLGLTLDEALEKMLDRIPSEDLAIAIHSVLILRETGGDLSETFETIAVTIRERRKVTGKINSMTQQGRMQGTILLLMPFGLMGLLYMVNPPYILPLFTTDLGLIMILVMLLFQGVGWMWVRKIVNIDV